MLPAPPVPAQTNDSLPTVEGGSIADDEGTSDRGGGGVVDALVDELGDDLAHLNNLDLTWGFDLDAFLPERGQQAPAAGDAGHGKAETTGSSRGGRKRDDRFVSLAPVEMADSETSGPCQGGAVNASSVPAGRAESDLSAA